MRKIATAAGIMLASAAFAQGVTPEGAWTVLGDMPQHVTAQEPWIRPQRFAPLALDQARMFAHLQAAPQEDAAGVGAFDAALFFWLPDPDGNVQCFKIVESSVMEPALQAQFPEIRTYVGVGVTDPTATVRLDFTDPAAAWNGAGAFHAQVLSERGAWYIDPFSRGNTTYYTSHYKRDLANPHEFSCLVQGDGVQVNGIGDEDGSSIARSGGTLRTYRLANAATGEYTAFHGGTVSAGQAAIVTAINRVSGVYEVEMSIRFTLVANNSVLVFTNAATDPYTNNDGGAMLGQNQSRINSVIGSANYDIGHVFSTGGGGVAQLACVCSSNNKSRGVTGLPSPTGDGFYIDYVCHEMGHQFGANHTFNSPASNCASNRAANSAYEPGSGSTIMSYSGICSPDNLQSASDPYFHSRSFDEIVAFSNTGGGNACAARTTTGNTAPTVSAGSARTIPISTPFALTATGSDANGDTLTYMWEQRNLGVALALSAADNGTSPIIRSRPGTTSPTRLFPRLATILAGTVDNQEKLPSVARSLIMRVTARDSRAGGGGVNTSDVTLTVTAAAGPFLVTSQNSGTISYAGGSTQTVTWDVANTTASPVNCANVAIDFSPDAGATWTSLIASTPNDGSQAVTMPTASTTTGRVRVSAVGNIFFDINNVPVRITTPLPSAPTNVMAMPNPACTGQTITLSGDVNAGETIDWYASTCGGVPFASGTSVTRTASATTTYWARARNTGSGQQSSVCTSVLNIVSAAAVAPSGASVDRNNFCTTDAGDITLSAQGGSGDTARWFTDSCGGTAIGTGSTLVIASPAATTDYFVRYENQCGTTACASVTVTVTTQAADFNADGEVDFFDYLDFVDAYSANDPSSDFNQDGMVDFFDYLDFVDAYSLGGC